jgi:hypothetical protein
VVDHYSAVRGILNDSQGGLLQPPSLNMAEALVEVQVHPEKSGDEKKAC